MGDRIDITMTAVLRGALLDGTLATISKKVCRNRDGFRLIINIDPVGENIKPMKLVNVAKKYFDDVVFNIADEPSFPKAVKWVWSQATAPYILHWEDDVNILRTINVDHMIKILETHKQLSSLRLFSGRTPRSKKAFFTFNSMWHYHEEGFYIATGWKSQFGLNPIMIKSKFVKEAVDRMVDHINPEKQFRFNQEYMRPLIKKWKYGLYAKPGEPRLIDGRKGQEWKNHIGLDKPKGQTFLKWEKKK